MGVRGNDAVHSSHIQRKERRRARILPQSAVRWFLWWLVFDVVFGTSPSGIAPPILAVSWLPPPNDSDMDASTELAWEDPWPVPVPAPAPPARCLRQFASTPRGSSSSLHVLCGNTAAWSSPMLLPPFRGLKSSGDNAVPSHFGWSYHAKRCCIIWISYSRRSFDARKASISCCASSSMRLSPPWLPSRWLPSPFGAACGQPSIRR